MDWTERIGHFLAVWVLGMLCTIMLTLMAIVCIRWFFQVCFP
jgi:hypothetical protein